MKSSYAYKPFAYRPPPELQGAGVLHPVLIVGAGPVGLAAAIDLALHGIRTIVIDDNDVVSVGSRAICWSKRTLEFLERLGVAHKFLDKGVTWKVGRVHHRDQLLYSFDLLPEGGHQMPAFVNLQQYYTEEYLVARAQEFPDFIELRWKHEFVGLRQHTDGVDVDVATADGRYTLRAQWLIAADGARSAVRSALGLTFEGTTFEEKFLIADIRWSDSPNERRFWFQPTFDPSESVLIHRQADGISRIDFQLGWDADAAAELQPARIAERVRRVVGPDASFELDWCSIYTFRCARLERFVHERVIFVGDSAHVVSPFGARGGNGGLQDVDNLCWKLALVLTDGAPRDLLDSYDEERGRGCDENILHASRTTRFMTPKSQLERDFRDGVLALACDFPFARTLVNSGRLSRPCSLEGLSHVCDERSGVSGIMNPGSPCADAPMRDASGRDVWLLQSLGGDFCAMTFAASNDEAEQCRGALERSGLGLRLCVVLPASIATTPRLALRDRDGLALERYGGVAGVTYLIRPDQHVAADSANLRYRSFERRAPACSARTRLVQQQTKATLRQGDGFGGRGDDFYASLLEAHEGLTGAESAALNSRLILLLANHIGDLDIIRQALHAARASLSSGENLMSKQFASHADLEDKVVSFDRLSEHAYAYTAQGDPNTGIVVGDDAVMVIDTQATPIMAQDVIRRIRAVTDKPIKYVTLSHYHAVRVLGVSAYGADHIIASQDTYDLIVERGAQDMKSEIERFPRLFRAVESVPGLTWPTLVFQKQMTLFMGKLEVLLMQIGRGHTKGDTVVWLPQERVLFSGDLVEYDATPYTGDAYLRDWPAALDAIAALKPNALVPGRGAALKTPPEVAKGLEGTRAFVSDLYKTVEAAAKQGKPLNQIYQSVYASLQPKYGHWAIFDHCLPFDVSRAYDEATQYVDPRIWTAERDKDMWASLEGGR